jgi:protein N-terminal glutamine amidohydrolase
MAFESLVRQSLDYQARYCEENVWRLLALPALGGRRAWAVIVSSEDGHFFALRQLAGRPTDGFACWDYHVFAVAESTDGKRWVLDLDSQLPFPCLFTEYLAETFVPLRHQPSAPMFRLISAGEYVTGLASDRSHMRTPGGTYLAPPPPWPAPGLGRENTLSSWIDVAAGGPGMVLDLESLCAFAAG